MKINTFTILTVVAVGTACSMAAQKLPPPGIVKVTSSSGDYGNSSRRHPVAVPIPGDRDPNLRL